MVMLFLFFFKKYFYSLFCVELRTQKPKVQGGSLPALLPMELNSVYEWVFIFPCFPLLEIKFSYKSNTSWSNNKKVLRSLKKNNVVFYFKKKKIKNI